MQTQATAMDAVVCVLVVEKKHNYHTTQLTRWRFVEKKEEVLQYICFALFNPRPIIGHSSDVTQLRLVLGGVVPWYQGLFNFLAQMIGDSGVNEFVLLLTI